MVVGVGNMIEKAYNLRENQLDPALKVDQHLKVPITVTPMPKETTLSVKSLPKLTGSSNLSAPLTWNRSTSGEKESVLRTICS